MQPMTTLLVQAVAHFLGPVLTLVLHSLVARQVGIEGYAGFSVFYSVGSLLGIAILGGCNLLAYRENAAVHDPDSLPKRSLLNYFLWSRVLVFLPTITVVAWIVSIGTWNAVDVLGVSQLEFVLAAVIVACSAGAAVFAAHMLRALDQKIEASFFTSTAGAIGTVGTFGVLSNMTSASAGWAAVASVVVGNVLAAGLSLIRVRQRLKVYGVSLPYSLGDTKRLLVEELRSFVASSAQVFLAAGDVILAALLFSPIVVSAVGVATRVAQIPMTIVNAFNLFAMGGLSKKVLHAGASIGATSLDLATMYYLRWSLLLIFLGTFLLAGDLLIEKMFGREFTDMYAFAAIVVCGVVFADFLGSPGLGLGLVGKHGLVSTISIGLIGAKLVLLVAVGSEERLVHVMVVLAGIWILNAVLLAIAAERAGVFNHGVLQAARRRNRTPRVMLVTGLPRSGTTWIGEMIRRITSCYYLLEPCTPENERPWFYNPSPNEWWMPQPRSGPALRLLEKTLLELPKGRITIDPKLMASIGWRDRLRYGRDICLSLAHRVRNQNIVIKDPNLALAVPIFLRCCANADVVFLIRHPFRFVSSCLVLQWRVADTLIQRFPELKVNEHASNGVARTWARFWTLVVRHGIGYKNTYPQVRFLRHEDISADPLAFARDIAIRFDTEWSTRIEKNLLILIRGGNTGKEQTTFGMKLNALSAISRDTQANLDWWKERIDQATMSAIWEETRVLATALGYREDGSNDGIADATLRA